MDKLSPSERSALMARVRAKDTKPELAVRRLVHLLGYRFRLHRRHLPGCPDLVFATRRKVVFVHGCFWHRHACPRGTRKKPMSAYWTAKIQRNVARDEANERALRELGWDVLSIWECDLKNLEEVERELLRFLGPRGAARPREASTSGPEEEDRS